MHHLHVLSHVLSHVLPFFVVGLATLTAGCSRPSSNPSAPSATASAGLALNADGSSLKVSAPTAVSPINGVHLEQQTPLTLVITNSTGSYASGIALAYRFEVLNPAGAIVYASPLVSQGSGSTTSHTVSADLEGEAPYTWQARGVFEGITGPVSARASFFAPPTDGYIKGNELYDPLINGKTVGEIHGAVNFEPGVGIRLLDQTSYVSYQLPQTLNSGEISALVWNITSGTPGTKTKVFSMSQGFDDITTNPRRFTVEKRGSTDAGAVAWRVITSEDQIETIGQERQAFKFLFTTLYYWRATFGDDGRNGFFNLTINEDGVGGRNMYDFGKDYSGSYNPRPHNVYLGSPPSRSGPDNQTVPNMVIRQLWVSSRPRPVYAMK